MLAACAMGLAAALLLARVHPFGDAGLYAVRAAPAPLLAGASVPEDVRGILAAKCADCHSTQTRSPIYGRLAPMSWLMERDIVEGRRHMNLSSWDSFTEDQQESFKAKIVERTKAHGMPPIQYRMIHWGARITDADVHAFSKWAHGSGVADAGSTAGEGDPVRGKALFEKRCTGCHALDRDREGPRLQGVYGRNSGAVAGFPYSDALKMARVVWNDETLEKWLTDPDVFLPGNNMDFLLARPQERKDVIAYFKQGVGK